MNPCYNPCEPDQETQEEIPCVDGEKCFPVIDLDCVVYTGSNLPGLGINTGDRGSKILNLLNQNHTSTGILTEDTNSVKIEGSGIDSDKLKATVILDLDVDNLITESVDGLLVKFTPQIILKLFQLIKDTPDLKDVWCDMIHECESCALITDFQVEIT